MPKVNLNDIPDAMEQITRKVRAGLFQIRDGTVMLVTEPKTIDFEFEVIISKDELQRVEINSRDGTTTTTTTEETTQTEVHSAATSVTDTTESGLSDESGNDSGGESGGESGGASGGQAGSSGDGGGELETYEYETDE